MNKNTIKADNGKVFRRISDGMIYDDEITLGYTYYIKGERLAEPHLDTADDFEEVDISELENIVNISE